MKVFFPSVLSPTSNGGPAAMFTQLARQDRIGMHEVVDDPDEADLLLFTEAHLLGTDWKLSAIRDSPLFKRYRHKSLVYDERDRPWCSVPGVYVSMPSASFNMRLQRSWSYFNIPERDRGADRTILGSFVASRSARCRAPLFEIHHPRMLIEEAVGFIFYDSSSKDYARRKGLFEESIVSSKFVLCPRGHGTSSIRMYEAMAAGSVPVVISDHWVPPTGVDLDGAILRWPEGRITGLVEFLESQEPDWRSMSSRTAEVFDRYFAPPVSFHNIVEQCAHILGSGFLANYHPETLSRACLASALNATLVRSRERVVRLLAPVRGT